MCQRPGNPEDVGRRGIGFRSLTEAINTTSSGWPHHRARPALSDDELSHARALLRDPDISVEQVDRRFRVAPSTPYRHLPGEGGAILRGQRPVASLMARD